MDFFYLELINHTEDLTHFSATPTCDYFLSPTGVLQGTNPLRVPSKITSISSYNSILIITTVSGVYTYGSDPFQYGLLGIPSLYSSDLPLKIPDLEGEFIESSISRTHAMVISKEGPLYCWGFLRHLGIDAPTIYKLDPCNLFIAQGVHCGEDFTAVSTMGGFVYVYKDFSTSPVFAVELNSYFILKISGNQELLLALSDTGAVFIWDKLSFVRLAAINKYLIDEIACGQGCVLAVSSEKSVVYQWHGDNIENYRGVVLSYNKSLRIFSGEKIYVVGDGVKEIRWEMIDTLSLAVVSEREKAKIVRRKEHRKSIEILRSSMKIRNSADRAKYKTASSCDFRINDNLALVIRNITKKRLTYCVNCIKTYGKRKQIIKRSIEIAKVYSVVYKFSVRSIEIWLKTSFNRLKGLKKENKANEFYKALEKFMRKRNQKIGIDILKRIRVKLSSNIGVIMILYKMLTDKRKKGVENIIRKWRLLSQLKGNGARQYYLLTILLRKYNFSKILLGFQRLKINASNNLKNYYCALSFLRKMLEQNIRPHVLCILGAYAMTLKQKKIEYKAEYFVKIVSAFTHKYNKNLITYFFTKIQLKIAKYRFIIYSLNSFTLTIIKIKFRLKYESLTTIKSCYYHLNSLMILNNLNNSRIHQYFLQFQKFYFGKSMICLIDHLSTIEYIYNLQSKLYCLHIFLQLPPRLKKPFISASRLWLNKKQKMEKELLAIKESMLTPKNFTKVVTLKFNSGSFTPDNKQLLCSTDRRMQYSSKLLMKKRIKSSKQLKVFESNMRISRKYYSPILLLIKSLKTIAVRILLFETFRIKRNKKFKSFSILTKFPPLSLE